MPIVSPHSSTSASPTSQAAYPVSPQPFPVSPEACIAHRLGSRPSLRQQHADNDTGRFRVVRLGSRPSLRQQHGRVTGLTGPCLQSSCPRFQVRFVQFPVATEAGIAHRLDVGCVRARLRRRNHQKTQAISPATVTTTAHRTPSRTCWRRFAVTVSSNPGSCDTTQASSLL